MILTEEEARQRRCCGPHGCGEARGESKPRFCIATQCMAWQWVDPKNDDALINEAAHGRPYGFCGLAGKVES